MNIQKNPNNNIGAMFCNIERKGVIMIFDFNRFNKNSYRDEDDPEESFDGDYDYYEYSDELYYDGEGDGGELFDDDF